MSYIYAPAQRSTVPSDLYPGIPRYDSNGYPYDEVMITWMGMLQEKSVVERKEAWQRVRRLVDEFRAAEPACPIEFNRRFAALVNEMRS